MMQVTQGGKIYFQVPGFANTETIVGKSSFDSLEAKDLL